MSGRVEPLLEGEVFEVKEDTSRTALEHFVGTGRSDSVSVPAWAGDVPQLTRLINSVYIYIYIHAALTGIDTVFKCIYAAFTGIDTVFKCACACTSQDRQRLTVHTTL